MAQVYSFVDENGTTRLFAEIHPDPTGTPFNGGTITDGLDVELSGSTPFRVVDADSAQTVMQVASGAVLLRSIAPNTYFSGGLNNLDLSMPSAIGRLTLDDFSGNDLVKIIDGAKLGLYGKAPAVQPSVTSGTVTPEQLALALQSYGALGGS